MLTDNISTKGHHTICLMNYKSIRFHIPSTICHVNSTKINPLNYLIAPEQNIVHMDSETQLIWYYMYIVIYIIIKLVIQQK